MNMKLNEFFADHLSEAHRNDLATLIYYPQAKMRLISQTECDMDNWYLSTLDQLVRFCRFVSVKHT